MALCWHYPNLFPSVARIAGMASQSERSVRHCLRSLQTKGLIEVHYRRDGLTQDTSFYTINPDRILMQAGKRAKTTLKSGGTQFRGVGNSLQGEGEELASPKHSALDKELEQCNKKQEGTEKEDSKQPHEQDLEGIEPYQQDLEVAALQPSAPSHPHLPSSAPPLPLPLPFPQRVLRM